MKKLIFGYGSLLAQRSRALTWRLDTAILPARLNGYSRRWNSRSMQLGGGISFLGLRKEITSTCNGILVEVDDDQYERILKRESGYSETGLSLSDFDFFSSHPFRPEQKIITFTNDSTDTPNDSYPIVQSYVDLCLEGCIEIEKVGGESGIDFSEEFILSTKDWSKAWVNDRVHARRPFVEYPAASRIDQLIRKFLPDYVSHIKISS
jgi:hypothetical protein